MAIIKISSISDLSMFADSLYLHSHLTDIKTDPFIGPHMIKNIIIVFTVAQYARDGSYPRLDEIIRRITDTFEYDWDHMTFEGLGRLDQEILKYGAELYKSMYAVVKELYNADYYTEVDEVKDRCYKFWKDYSYIIMGIEEQYADNRRIIVQNTATMKLCKADDTIVLKNIVELSRNESFFGKKKRQKQLSFLQDKHTHLESVVKDCENKIEVAEKECELLAPILGDKVKMY